MAHSTRVQMALARLPEIDPAIAALALWCSYRDTDSPTMTRGETIQVGPEFPLLPLSEQTGLIAHHVLHVALRHSARRSAARDRYGAGFDETRYDLACDALVNEALLQAGHALPRPAVRAGDLVALLPQDERPANVLADWDCDALYRAMADNWAGAGGGQDGTIAQHARAQGFSPDLGGSDPDTAEAEIWAGRMAQAMSAGNRAGSGIGAVLTRFGDLPKARVPWEVKLRRLLAKTLSQHPRQSHRRPARSWLARDAFASQSGSARPVFEPALMHDFRRPRLVIGLDTSSSIPGRTLDLFAAEALSAVRKTGAEAHLLGFDTEVHSRTRFDTPNALGGAQMRRDGGTDFAPILAEAEGLDPSMIIVLTDLDAPTPAIVRAPVLWAVPAPPRNWPGVGEVLVLDDLP